MPQTKTTKRKNQLPRSVWMALVVVFVLGAAVLCRLMAKPCTITYVDEVTSNPVLTQTVPYGGRAVEPAAPAQDGNGKEFVGWAANPKEPVYWSFDTPILGDVTLYAVWRES